MKKILEINSTSFYSTGTIMSNIARELNSFYEFYIASGDTNLDTEFKIIKNKFFRELNKIKAQLFGIDGFTYSANTRNLINYIEQIKPDLVHIHNAHGYYLNIRMLLDFLFKNNIPIVITMHDCWTFTGRCGYFDNVSCFRWQTGCLKCPYKKEYPRSRLFDLSHKQWLLKKQLFTNHNITFVTPSKWLKNLAKESFLLDEKIIVINNGIDTSLYANNNDVVIPCEIDISKKIILSIASPFTDKKGLSDINKLNKLIDHNIYQIVIVGAFKENISDPGIVRINPTKDKKLLAKLYQIAYVFLLLSHQDNYPTVLLESLASGTPIITYNVGGCPEIVDDEITGFVVNEGDVDEVYLKIQNIDAINRTIVKEIGQKHNIKNYVSEYHKLYKEILGE